MVCWRPRTRRLFLLAACLLFGSAAAAAQEDPRFSVLVTPADEQESVADLHADVRTAARRALPVLWDRLIPASAREQAPDEATALRLLRRAVPTPEGVRIVFDRERVARLLDEAGIPWVRTPPRWSIELRLTSDRGGPMRQTRQLLMDRIPALAEQMGFVPDAGGDALILHFRWLDARQVSLTVRGTTPLGELAETRLLAGGDPLPQLETWLRDLLVRARDAAADSGKTVEPAVSALPVDAYGKPAASARPEVLLSVLRPSGLAEQVLFEQELRRDPRVKAVIPLVLSREERRYRILLAEPDALWLEGWLTAQGLEVARDEQGWTAR